MDLDPLCPISHNGRAQSEAKARRGICVELSIAIPELDLSHEAKRMLCAYNLGLLPNSKLRTRHGSNALIGCLSIGEKYYTTAGDSVGLGAPWLPRRTLLERVSVVVREILLKMVLR